jgi:multisubunit Na+/H+ antiporter MnhB subunit
MIAIYVLMGLMIVGAIIAIEVKNLLSAVVALGTVGLMMSILFLLMKAPDVAITLLVVEILAVIILIRATLKRDVEVPEEKDRPIGGLIALAFLLVLTLVSAGAFGELPPFGQPQMRVASYYVNQGYSLEGEPGGTGAANVVASVILDYRAYDTLGEATVLFTAVVGVLAVMRSVGRKKDKLAAAPEKAEEGGSA